MLEGALRALAVLGCVALIAVIVTAGMGIGIHAIEQGQAIPGLLVIVAFGGLALALSRSSYAYFSRRYRHGYYRYVYR